MRNPYKVMLAIVLTLSFVPTEFAQTRKRKAKKPRPAPGSTQRTLRAPTGSATASGPPSFGGTVVASLGVTTEVTVQPDGTFVTVLPGGTLGGSHIRIKPGDTVRWINLRREDSIVQIKRPDSIPGADACGIVDNQLRHQFDGTDPNEFTGPKRYGVSGIFALGPNGPGFESVPQSQQCACQAARNCPGAPPTANQRKLCSGEGRPYETLMTTWNNPDITGVIIRIDWKDIQTEQHNYNWNVIDREMDRAVRHGKLFTLDIKAGAYGTPEFIFSERNDGGTPGTVRKYWFKDSGDAPSGDCGKRMALGSPTDPNYQNYYIDMINHLAEHVAKDSRWFQALAHVKVSGANLYSSEARLPKSCFDSADSDDRLDTINGDDCVCNTKRWADAGYTPEGLFQFYRVVGNAIYNAFYKRKSLGYQLIQAGFPLVKTSTNFQGDSLKDQAGVAIQPGGTILDDLNGVVQTETILEQGRDGRFVEPTRELINEVEGGLFVPQHSGLGRLPEDEGSPRCPQHQEVFGWPPMAGGFPKANFPIGKVAGGSGDGCPNPWAVNEGTLHNQIMGFQTNNNNQPAPPPGSTGHTRGIGSPADVESALWNMTINSNGVFIELYEERLWEISQKLGSGSTAGVLSPNGRANRTTAPYSMNLFTWLVQLHDRRRQLAGLIKNPYAADPFPTVYEFTFTGPETTYYYINPWQCATTQNPNRVGMITVTNSAR